MDLGPFLRGDPPRPNPAPEPARGWRIELREPEGGDWRLVNALRSEREATDEATAPVAAPAYGALVRVVSPAGATTALWVQGAAELWRADSVPNALAPEGRPGYDWVTAWEVDSPDRDAASMVRAAQYADRRRLVRAACDCADLAVAELPPEHTAARAALATVRGWAWGPPGKAGDAVRAAEVAAREAVRGLEDRFYEACYAVEKAAMAATAMGVAQYAGHACESVEWAGKRYGVGSVYRPAESRAARALQPALVRRHLPLSVALLSCFDEPTPTDLGF